MGSMIKQGLLKRLREEGNHSQLDMAECLEISRPSYLLIEKGEKDLTLSQLSKLADFYGVTADSILAGQPEPKIQISVEKSSKTSIKKSNNLRINIPQKKLDKFKEVFLYILEKVGSRPNVGMAVIYKLFYFIDFDYYEKYEEQLIGATYIKNHFGPTPVEFIKLAKEMIAADELEEVKSKYFEKDQTKYLPHRCADLSQLSAREIKHIDNVLDRLAAKNASEMRDYSHKDVPWIVAKEGQPIEYESVFYRTDDTTDREYDADSSLIKKKKTVRGSKTTSKSKI